MENIAFYKETLRLLEEKVQELQDRLFMKEKDFEAYRNEKEKDFEAYRNEKEQELCKLKAQAEDLLTQRDALSGRLNEIYQSYSWKGISRIIRIIESSSVLRATAKLLLKIINKAYTLRVVPLDMQKESGSSGHPAHEVDFNPYRSIELLRNIDIEVVEIDFNKEDISTKFSLVSPVKNEEENIADFLSSIEHQELRPSEVIIIDGGSTDKTAEIIEEYSRSSTLPVRLIKSNAGNISKQRNMGIREAANQIIVLADAGCILDKGYCKNLVGCFEKFEGADLAGAIYHPMKVSSFSNALIYDWESMFMNWREFLPAGKSMAIKKATALRIGGFPEFLALTGEDTLFDIEYRRLSHKWVFNKKAFVYWDVPSTKEAVEKKVFGYAKGDGESGIGNFRFYGSLIEYKKHGDIDGDFIKRESFKGFMEGRRNRGVIEFDKRDIVGLVLILTESSFTDMERSRKGTQLALEFINKKFKVVFVNIFPPREFREEKYYFDIDYTLLELYHITEFDPHEFIEQYERILDKTRVILVDQNHAFDPIIEIIKKKNEKTEIVNAFDPMKNVL